MIVAAVMNATSAGEVGEDKSVLARAIEDAQTAAVDEYLRMGGSVYDAEALIEMKKKVAAAVREEFSE